MLRVVRDNTIHSLSTLWEDKALPCQPINEFVKTCLITFTGPGLNGQPLQSSKLFPHLDALLAAALNHFSTFLTHFI